MSTVPIRVFRNGQSIFEVALPDRLLIGRRDEKDGDPEPGKIKQDRLLKYVIADSSDTTVSRDQLLIERIGDDRYRLTNRSKTVHLFDSSNSRLTVGQQTEQIAPFVVSFGETWAIRVEQATEEDDLLTSVALDVPTLAPGQMRTGKTLAEVIHGAPDAVDPKELARCLLDTMPSFQKAASAAEFFQHAADALVETIGLDFAAALTWDGTWRTVATCGSENTEPSTRILNEVYSRKCAVREVPSQLAAHSLESVNSLVAAPLLDADGSIVGAVYGDRRYSSDKPSLSISELEAMFVELVASGAANGLARLKQQEAAAHQRSNFEHFFGPELAHELEKDPHLLDGRSSDVTVLFCDIRGFSAVTDKLDVRKTLDWINDVLELLSTCVHDTGGVVVDYVGDEIMAMWGAPNPCEDHAQRACSAAVEMHRRLTEIDEKWESIIGAKTRISIGINSGEALVGNTGSRCKYKYGPLGTTVNKASRIQGTTKITQCDIVISDETHQRISTNAPTRRLCQVRVINLPQPITLFELAVNVPDHWASLVSTYEEALRAFETAEFPKAVERLGSLLLSYPHDGPTMVLLSRAVNAITNEPDESHPVWVLDKK